MPGDMSSQTTYATQQQVDAFVLEVLPAQGQWSENDYLWLTDHTTRLIEFSNGYIETRQLPCYSWRAVCILSTEPSDVGQVRRQYCLMVLR